MNEKEQNQTKQQPQKQNWFTRATLGAAMADSPAVMTASGWRRNDNGDYVQDKFDDPATNRLADNLGVISSVAQAGPTLIDDATLLYQVVRHPQQTWRTLSTGIKEAANKLIRRRPKTFPKVEELPLNVGWGPKQTIRVYRGNAKNVQYTPGSNGEAGRKYVGQWFTTDPDKPLWYLSNYRKGRKPIPIENLELQYVDIPEKDLIKHSASKIKEIAESFEYEPDDLIIPLGIKRNSLPLGFDPAKYLQSRPQYQELIKSLKR